MSQKNRSPHFKQFWSLLVKFQIIPSCGPFYHVYQEKNEWWNISEDLNRAEISDILCKEDILKDIVLTVSTDVSSNATGCTLTLHKQTIKQILLLFLWKDYFRICFYFRQIKILYSRLVVTKIDIKTKSNVQLICISFKFWKCLPHTKYVISRSSFVPQKSFTTNFSPDKCGKMANKLELYEN